MRVITGSARGVRLYAPQGMQTRPTSDRVKEALFSIIAGYREIKGARVLDICAGTGSLGIEALSRGALFCCFIEQSRSALSVLERNVVATGFKEKVAFLPVDARHAVERAARNNGPFELVFFDPPYQSQLYGAVLADLVSHQALSKDSLVCVESSSRKGYDPVVTDGLELTARRIYGDTALDFYVRKES